MADLKISALTSATLPLAGTEVLPIVQSGTTKKVPTDDLTVKNLRSNATTGILQVVGPAAASTRVMTVPNDNFTAARIDAAQSFTGNQTLTDGNLIVSNGKGIDFSATPGTGTSELFSDYEEGSWTATFFTGANGTGTNLGSTSYLTNYVKIGKIVTVSFYALGFSATALSITGLPFVCASPSIALTVTGTRFRISESSSIINFSVVETYEYSSATITYITS